MIALPIQLAFKSHFHHHLGWQRYTESSSGKKISKKNKMVRGGLKGFFGGVVTDRSKQKFSHSVFGHQTYIKSSMQTVGLLFFTFFFFFVNIFHEYINETFRERVTTLSSILQIYIYIHLCILTHIHVNTHTNQHAVISFFRRRIFFCLIYPKCIFFLFLTD